MRTGHSQTLIWALLVALERGCLKLAWAADWSSRGLVFRTFSMRGTIARQDNILLLCVAIFTYKVST
jgi:hypothetical protein